MNKHYILTHEFDAGCPAQYEHFQGPDERPCPVCGVLLVKVGEGK